MAEPGTLRAEHLTVRCPGARHHLALDDITLDIPPGERLLMVGPNGAGKSTFIRAFAGLLRPAAGSAWIGPSPARAARHLAGVVGHATYLYDELSVIENLRFYAELYRAPDPLHRAEMGPERVGLWAHADEPVARLSRGQQQRVTLARALLHDPPVLLRDEPDTGLDVAAFQQLADWLTEGARTIVLTTHNLTAGLTIGTRLAVLGDGRLLHQRQSVALADAPWISQAIQQAASSESA